MSDRRKYRSARRHARNKEFTGNLKESEFVVSSPFPHLIPLHRWFPVFSPLSVSSAATPGLPPHPASTVSTTDPSASDSEPIPSPCSRSAMKIAFAREAASAEVSADNSFDYHLVRFRNLVHAVSVFTGCDSPAVTHRL